MYVALVVNSIYRFIYSMNDNHDDDKDSNIGKNTQTTARVDSCYILLKGYIQHMKGSNNTLSLAKYCCCYFYAKIISSNFRGKYFSVHFFSLFGFQTSSNIIIVIPYVKNCILLLKLIL